MPLSFGAARVLCVRSRPTAETSEQQLVAALAAGGRTVRVTDLINWRKNGLLPPLVSRGVGIARGKTYGWTEADILPRAELVSDAVRQYRRNDMALLLLFLSGYSVPLPQLRRAWTFRCKLRKPPTIRPMPVAVTPHGFQDGSPLLEAALAIAAAIQTDHHLLMIPLLERAMVKLGYTRWGRNGQMCRVMMAMEVALDASDLIRTARDEEIREAQHYLTLALKFLRDCAGQKERDGLTAIFGPSVFVFILAFLRSGQCGLFERVAAQIEEADRPVRASPAHAVRLHA